METSKTDLTPAQEMFCRWYTTPGETFSNATLSYAKAYDYKLDELSTTREIDDKGFEKIGSSEYDKAYKACGASGARLLGNMSILARKTELLNESFNDDSIADARLNEILISGKDTDSIQAIKERNSLKQRITKKLDITSAGRPLAGLSDEELDNLAKS